MKKTVALFQKNIFAGLLLTSALLPAYAQAEIQTLVVGTTAKPSNSTSKFEGLTSETPCYVHWAQDNPAAFKSVIATLRSEGFNITSDENAACMIEVTGYVTVPSTTSGSVPVNLIFALSNDDRFKEIGPALKSSVQNETGAIANHAAGMANDPVGANGLNTLSQAGGVVNGVQGSVAGVVLGTLANIFNSVQARQETPPGVVFINGLVMFGHFMPKIPVVTGVYAASTTAVKPQELIDAGIKQFAKVIWEEKNKYNEANGLASYSPTRPSADAAGSAQVVGN